MVNEIVQRVESDSVQLQSVVRKIIEDNCGELNDKMREIQCVLDTDIPTKQIESFLISLSSILYWTGTGLEETTIKESVAKMVYAERYNQHHQSIKGTIADKKALAEIEAQEEELVRVCYSQAVNLYKHKIEKATEMVNVLKKILNNRALEYQYGGKE